MIRSAAATLVALTLLISAEEAAACQNSTHAFAWAKVEVRERSGASFAAFVHGWPEKVDPLIAPKNLSGESNWLDTPIDRIEIAQGVIFERDPFTVLGLLRERLYYFLLGYRGFEVPEVSDVGRYKFKVLETLKGSRRQSFTVGTQRPARQRFWAFRPLTGAEETEVGDWNKSDTVIPYFRKCSTYYGFRLNRPALFYWRGKYLASVAEISPEALNALKVGTTAPR